MIIVLRDEFAQPFGRICPGLSAPSAIEPDFRRSDNESHASLGRPSRQR